MVSKDADYIYSVGAHILFCCVDMDLESST